MKYITVCLTILALVGCTITIAMHDHDGPMATPTWKPYASQSIVPVK